MAWFITKGTDRKTRAELEKIRKALERLADVAELHFGARSGPSLRSFYKDGNPKAVDEAELAYIDDEEAWIIEQAERSGVSADEFREKLAYATGGDEERRQDQDER